MIHDVDFVLKRMLQVLAICSLVAHRLRIVSHPISFLFSIEIARRLVLILIGHLLLSWRHQRHLSRVIILAWIAACSSYMVFAVVNSLHKVLAFWVRSCCSRYVIMRHWRPRSWSLYSIWSSYLATLHLLPQMASFLRWRMSLLLVKRELIWLHWCWLPIRHHYQVLLLILLV